ncbi:hypothetical protein [uncultured Tateyamaria sp.]|uniref:hypothetical protein n=1 Tax=uncultured Tateyamaria sp. TaxID=455651 RepID=UPI00263175C5|nr:hypothetical protein [uncultured Tateyamaria sp.]
MRLFRFVPAGTACAVPSGDVQQSVFRQEYQMLVQRAVRFSDVNHANGTLPDESGRRIGMRLTSLH